MSKTGGCLCGKVRYEIAVEPVVTAICHCKNCQKQSGAAFSVNLGIPAAAITLKGELKTFIDSAESGGEVRRSFCANCGSPLVSAIASSPELVFLKAGTLDDTSAVQPVVEVWCNSRQPWVEPSARPSFPKNPG
jgi:hypothetical protein